MREYSINCFSDFEVIFVFDVKGDVCKLPGLTSPASRNSVSIFPFGHNCPGRSSSYTGVSIKQPREQPRGWKSYHDGDCRLRISRVHAGRPQLPCYASLKDPILCPVHLPSSISLSLPIIHCPGHSMADTAHYSVSTESLKTAPDGPVPSSTTHPTSRTSLTTQPESNMESISSTHIIEDNGPVHDAPQS